MIGCLVDITADTMEAITVAAIMAITTTMAVVGTVTAHRHLVATAVLVARVARR